MDEYGPGSPVWELSDMIREGVRKLRAEGYSDTTAIIKFLKDSLDNDESWIDDEV